jgi:aryl-alcohol dehydrogenase
METRAAVVFERSGKFSIEKLQISDPNDDEVLVRIVGAGICHTDLAARDMHLPIPPERALPGVFGHEGAGVVERVGAGVSKVKPGDHVALGWNSCGACPACMSGDDPYCDNLFLFNFNGARPDGTTTLRKGDQVIYGSFFSQSSLSQFALANERNVVKVTKDVPLEILGPLGCGVRPVGMSAVLAAVVCGCTTVVAVDIHKARLEKAKEFGATHTINANETDPVEAIRKMTGGGVEYSLECVGNPKVLRQAVDILPRRGVCGLLGVVPPGTEVGLDMDLIMNGRTVRGILAGDSISDLIVPKLIELYRQGRFPFDQLITFYPFEEINRAVEDMEKGRVIKPVLRM